MPVRETVVPLKVPMAEPYTSSEYASLKLLMALVPVIVALMLTIPALALRAANATKEVRRRRTTRQRPVGYRRRNKCYLKRRLTLLSR
jgi:hypothetical protein